VNGRIDLPQAEAVNDLIQATTLHQAKVAARQMEGGVARLLKPVKSQLLELIALLEAGIDFAEDDVSVAADEELLRRISSIVVILDRLTESFRYGKLVHDGLTLAIVGRPNVGKSSLFNALLQRDRAIVTALPGPRATLFRKSPPFMAFRFVWSIRRAFGRASIWSSNWASSAVTRPWRTQTLQL